MAFTCIKLNLGKALVHICMCN